MNSSRAYRMSSLNKIAQQNNLSVDQLAAIGDEALDNAYHYGRSTPGKTFGWMANLQSAKAAKQLIDAGETDIEKISHAIHEGWNVTARAFVANADQFSDTQALKGKGKFEAKMEQRNKLASVSYDQLPEDEKEKDRVVARALLEAIVGKKTNSSYKGANMNSRILSRTARLNKIADMNDPDYHRENNKTCAKCGEEFDSSEGGAEVNGKWYCCESCAGKTAQTSLSSRQIRQAKLNKIADAAMKEMFDKIMSVIDAGQMAPEKAVELRERIQSTLSGFLADERATRSQAPIEGDRRNQVRL